MRIKTKYKSYYGIRMFALIVLTSSILTIFMLYSNQQFSKKINSSGKTTSSTLISGTLFLSNEGQVDPEVAFYTNLNIGSVFITQQSEIVYNLNSKTDAGKVYSFKEEFCGSNNVSILGEQSTDTKINIFNGRDSLKWFNNVPSYKSLSVKISLRE